MADGHLVALRGDEAALCCEHHAALRRVVARRVRMSSDLLEDACQHAWLMMMRRQPQRGPTLFGWLCTVAIREAYRIAGRQARNVPLDDLAVGRGEPENVALSPSAAHVAEQRLEARRALQSVASLPAKQRRYVVLRVAGLSYREVAEREGVTYTNVDSTWPRRAGGCGSCATKPRDPVVSDGWSVVGRLGVRGAGQGPPACDRRL